MGIGRGGAGLLVGEESRIMLGEESSGSEE